MKVLPSFFMLIFCLGSFALSAQSKAMARHDENKDNRLSRDEYGDMLRKNKVFAEWDQNNNGFISLQEWNDALDKYYSDMQGIATYANYLKWDLNADHYLNDDEFRIGNFELWDENNNEYVDPEEWTRYETWSF